MEVIKKISILSAVLVVSYVVALTLVPAELYKFFFPPKFDAGLFIGYQALAEFMGGFVIAYAFFLPLLFVSLGSRDKYWWASILLSPVALFIYFDLAHFWFYILVGLAGWGVGLGVAKITSLLKKNSVSLTS